MVICVSRQAEDDDKFSREWAYVVTPVGMGWIQTWSLQAMEEV